MNKKNQYGKAIVGFIGGLIIALLIVAALLFVLNRNSEQVFKQPQLSGNEGKPQIIVPEENAPPAPPRTPSSDEPKLEDLLPPSEPQDFAGIPTYDTSGHVRTEEDFQSTHELPAAEAPPPVMAKPKPEPVQSPKAAVRPKQDMPPEKNARETTQLTLDQIFNGERVKQEKTVETESKPRVSGSRVLLQMGSYNNLQSADAQRAKLALLGVSARIAEVQIEGKTVYRVQTDVMDGAQAADIQQQLQQNGIASFTRKQ